MSKPLNNSLRNINWSAPSEEQKVLTKPQFIKPANFQAAKLLFPAPWWSKLNDPQFCGEHIKKLEDTVAHLKSCLRKQVVYSQCLEMKLKVANSEARLLQTKVTGLQVACDLMDRKTCDEPVKNEAIKRLLEM